MPRLLKFILLVSYSDILVAVFILSMSAICGGFSAVSKGESLAHERTSSSEFILLVSFNDTLLVVSILSVIAICGCFCSPRSVINSSCGK